MLPVWTFLTLTFSRGGLHPTRPAPQHLPPEQLGPLDGLRGVEVSAPQPSGWAWGVILGWDGGDSGGGSGDSRRGLGLKGGGACHGLWGGRRARGRDLGWGARRGGRRARIGHGNDRRGGGAPVAGGPGPRSPLARPPLTKDLSPRWQVRGSTWRAGKNRRPFGAFPRPRGLVSVLSAGSALGRQHGRSVPICPTAGPLQADPSAPL